MPQILYKVFFKLLIRQRENPFTNTTKPTLTMAKSDDDLNATFHEL